MIQQGYPVQILLNIVLNFAKSQINQHLFQILNFLIKTKINKKT